jgi:branched-subunit amino acid ABC-type transport system permease component
MDAYLPFIVIGLATGSIYAIAAMGLVVTYTTSGVFNFAHGAVGMIATFAFYSMRVDLGVPTGVAMAIAVLVVGPALGVFIDRVLLRRLSGATAATYVVVSLGLLVALQGLAIALYGPTTRPVEAIFPRWTYRLGDLQVGIDQTLLVVIAAASALALVFFFQRTRLGLYTRAVVEDPDLTELNRLDSRRIATFSWMLGCAFAALSGVLLAPVLGLDAVLLTLLVIQAFGAAVVGRLTNLRGAYVGAIIIGVVASLSTKFVADTPSLAGLPPSLPFLILFAVLVFSRKGSFSEFLKSERTSTIGRMRSAVSGRRFPLPVLVGAVAVAVVVPLNFNGSQLLTATSVLAFVLIFSSLGLLIGLSRQVSLAHAVFVVFGATTLAHLQQAGVPYLLALLLSGLVMVPVGAIVAIPAIRLSGLFLALATFGFGVLAQNLLFSTALAFGSTGVVSIQRPEILGVSLAGDQAFYYFVGAVVLAGVVIIEVIRVSRLGRILRALGDAPTAIQSLGINPLASRVLVFCLSAFLAAVAGGLQGTLTQSVNALSFDFFQSLLWVTVLVTAGAASLGGAILAALLLVAVPAVFTSGTVVEWLPVAFGISAIVLAQSSNGLAGLIRFRSPDFSTLAKAASWRLESTPRRAERLAEVTR